MELAIFSEAQSSFTLRAGEDAQPGYPSVKGYGLGVSTHRIPIEFTHFRYTESYFVPMLGREAEMFFASC